MANNTNWCSLQPEVVSFGQMVQRTNTDEHCRHCGQPPRAEMQRDHRFFPWLMVRTGPASEWQHHYCSEECAAHADEYSRKEWDKRHGK